MADVPTYPQNTVVTDIDGVNEVQRVTVSTVTNGKTLTLEFDGEISDAIAKNASLSTVKSELEELSNIDLVSVTGTVSDHWDVEFQGELAAEPLQDLVAVAAEGTATVATTVVGKDQDETDAVQRGTGNADRTDAVSPLEGLSPAEYRDAHGSDFGDS